MASTARPASYRHRIVWGAAAWLLAGTAAAVPPAPWGRWARDLGQCTRPEIELTANAVKIVVEADGTPAEFVYANVSYRTRGNALTAELGRPHPYAKAPAPTELTFKVESVDRIVLSMSPRRDVPFVRCPPY